MAYPAIPLHKAERVGGYPQATVMWDGDCIGGSKLHVGRVAYAEGYEGDDIPAGWQDVHPDACERCGVAFDPEAAPDHRHAGSVQWLWNTPSGKLEPGCAWVVEPGEEHRDDGTCYLGNWTNCDGRHHQVVLPNGHQWTIDGRARNCGLPDDTEHRCWVFEGDNDDPSTWHVSKDGRTCAAGAGSISADGYHGFIRRGVLTAG